jgi:ABC-2 type transport system permease protein
MIFFAPVYFPAEAMPEPLRSSSVIWPTTHAAAALRGLAAGQSLADVLPALLVLALFAVALTILAPARLSWRGEH